jgi:anti-sigma factor RsiW
MSCERTRELSAELALGILDGEQRAQALRHVAECRECRREVQELTAVADELLMLAPEREPPAGFESRVLARLQPPPAVARTRRQLRRAFAPVAAAAAAAAIAAAAVLQTTSDDRRLADHYRATLAAGHGSSFEAARLRAPGRVPAGVVYAYRGATSWIFVVVYGPHRGVPYTAELVTTSGRRVALPSLRLDPSTGTSGEAIPVDLGTVSSVRLVGPKPGDVLEADLTHAR